MDPPDPALVGKAFVKQYYTQMHRDPSQMHRFYLEQSSFVHGGSEIGSEEPVIGQKSINDKILSLDLQQVHAKIKQVDSHITLGSGIVIQVTGELSISGRPMRAFVQTFVLAPESPKKYYVHNDIFRYQDDDLVSESETNEGPGEGENPPIVDHSAEEGEYTHPLSSETSPDVSKDERSLYVATTTEMGGGVTELENPEVGGETTWNQYGGGGGGEPAILPDLQQNGLSGEEVTLAESSAPQPSSQEYVALEPPGHVSEGEGVSETTAESFHTSETHEADSSKMNTSTWASRLTRGGGGGGGGYSGVKQPPPASQPPSQRPVNSFPVSMSTSQALPQREPRRRPERDMGRAKDASKKGAPIISPKDAPDSHQIFVGGLPGNSNEQDLRSLFAEYGSIIEVRVNPKNFAFVVFDNAESVQKIMNERDRIQLKSKYLNIEPKRPSMSRGPSGSGRGKPLSSGSRLRSSKPPKR